MKSVRSKFDCNGFDRFKCWYIADLTRSGDRLFWMNAVIDVLADFLRMYLLVRFTK